MSSDPLYTPPSSSSSSGQDPDYVRTVVSDTPSSASPDGAGSGSSPPSQSSGSSSTGGSLSQSFRERYQIIRILGKGGFGTVYLAHDRVLDQHVAIKVLTLTSATGNELKRFIFEARTSAKLRHPAIVNVFDIVQHEGKLQLVMEYYPGGSLSQLIKDKGAIPPVQALLCTRQIAAGLGFAHKNGIIHRDIKPANIFLAGDDIVKLGDFGIAAHAEHHENTMTGEVMGSPLYMSPEQTKDSKNIDGRSDLYSLGLTLYHMLTGEPPRVLDMDDLHPLLRPLLKSVTAFELNDRPANAEEFIQRIDGTLASLYAAGMGNAPGAHPGQPGIAFPYPTGTPTRTAPGTPTPTGTGNALSPTLTAPTPHGTLIPPGYAGPDDVTMTAPAPAAASAQSVKMMMWIIILLMVVVIGGFAAVIGVIRKQSNRPPRSGAAVASVPAA
ncbi:serine/threonine protein kinase, partial [Candidatus Sumerlaeota bacterium]|nr:serine/threonine protein kinase [Candidatus Sumerlaeota bacterium]